MAGNVIIYPDRVIVVLGQSQGTNVLGPTKYTFRNTSVVKQLNVSDGTISSASEPFLGVDGTDSTFFGEMIDGLADDGKWDRVIVAPIAVSGSYAAEWASGGTYYSRITTILSQISSLNLKIGAIIWVQGEADALVTTTAAQYRSSVISALAAFRNAGVRAPFFVAKETWIYGALPSNASEIRAAQGALPNADMGVFAGPDLDTFGNSYRADDDQTHFNNAGKSAVAQMWLPYIRQRLH